MRFNPKEIINRLRQLPRDPAFYRNRLKLWIKQAWENRPPSAQVLRITFLSLGIIFALNLLLILSVYFGAFGRLPSKADLLNINNANASEIYATDGIQLGKYYNENRTNASLSEIPYYLINGLVATEDARFYQHSGVDPRALLRVFFRTVLMGDLDSGGGSTLSQQLVKNVYGRERYGLLSIPVNKIREIMVARRLERVYSKAEIMELYLNTVPFGERDVYGIKVAARRFFNKSLFELNIQESAVLIGMLKGNTLYNPILNPEASVERRNTVLRRMAQADFLTQNQYDSIAGLPLKTDYVREGKNQGLATYFRAHLQEELEEALQKVRKPDGSLYDLKKDGLKIYTTIDARLQSYAESAVNEVMPEVQKRFSQDWSGNRDPIPPSLLAEAIQNSGRYQSLINRGFTEETAMAEMKKTVKMRLFSWEDKGSYQDLSPIDSIRQQLTTLHAGMIVADPKTGAIRAWIGGIDHGYFQYDHVKSTRQVGSTFKPVVYAQALEDARYPCDYFENERKTYAEFEDWSPRNSDGKYGGYYSMPGALSNSVNTVTVQLALETGLEKVRNMAGRLGLEGQLPEGPAISLGTTEASLLEMIRVYGTFANQGKRPEWHYLDRIEDREGNIIFEYPKPSPATFEQVLSPETNALIVNLLETVVDSGTARRLRYQYGLASDIAGKTGTTQNQSDGWFLGFTPNLVFGAWVGAELPTVHFRTLYRGQGSNTALPMVGSFLQKTYKDPNFRKYRNAQFPPLVDSLAYMLDCPHYLDSLPEEIEYLNDYFQQPGFFDRLYRELNQGDFSYPIELKRPRRNESEADYIDRMRRYNERLQRRDERREDLKDFWSDKLFGGSRRNNN
ncbi:MAG TPA: transglycosylase domain-containing protein [Saprospiraceae bacterium]|nr:transglycosylase domain-containing protein [Saprospiraceae bacterium]